MEVLLILLALVLLVASATVLVARRRRADDTLLEGPLPPLPRDVVADRSTTLDQTPVTAPSEAEAPPVPVDEGLVAEVEEALAPVEVPPAPPVRPSFRERLTKARSTISGYVGSVLSRQKIDGETWDELEEALIRADVGVAGTTAILEQLRATVDAQGVTDPSELIARLKQQLKDGLAQGDQSLRFDPGAPNVWLFVGVNGVGKTTTIAKVARRELANGRSVVMAAGDTFRAAAAEQLTTWAERTGADIVRGNEGGDPSAVIFDAVQRAGARGTDLVLADTAGRLHTKVNLMEELRKVRRVADREPGRVTEVLLVLDATTGQNGLVQARQFTEAVELTGVVLTKLDGSAKGGIALAIQTELGIPIKLVGLGETMDDLVEFDPDEFVEALFAVA